MKLTILAVALLALGVALGLALHGQLDGPAVAAPPCPPKCPTPTATPTPTPPPQAREDQVIVFSASLTSAASLHTDSYGPLTNAGPVVVALDAAEYPPSASFRLEGVLRLFGSASTHCVRLFDLTAGSPVAGSDVCHTTAVGTSAVDIRVRSAAFNIPNGEHEYTVEGFYDHTGDSIFAARIIVEWAE